MIRLARPGLFLLFLPLALSQLALPAQSPSSTPGTQLCTVAGMVIDASTGQALHKISLQLFSRNPSPPATERYGNSQPQAYNAVSDDAGRFVFGSVLPGQYGLDGQGNDYPSQAYQATHETSSSTILRLTSGEELKNLVFRLEPGVVMTGKVVDEDGDPIAGAYVQALVKWHYGQTVRYGHVGQGQTDDRGEYRIFGMPAGRLFVEATPGFNARGSVNGGVYVPEFYPGTTDPSQATPVESHPGDILTGIDIQLTPTQPAQIGGQLIDGTTGKPVTTHTLYLRPRTLIMGGFTASTTSEWVRWAPQGRFWMTRVAPGSYILVANMLSGHSPIYAQVPVDLSPGEKLSGLEVTLMPLLELSGRVGADPSPALKFDHLWVTFVPGASGPLPWPASARVKTDGTFVLKDVRPGNYRINVAGFPPQYYLKSATLGGADVLENGLTLTAGEPPGMLALFLSLDGGSIQGTVLDADEKSVAGAVVALIPDPPRRDRQDLYSSVRTDANGVYNLPGLAPGDYKLFAWEDLEHHSFEDPDFIRLFEDRGKEVEVHARAQQQVQLQVIPASAMPAQ